MQPVKKLRTHEKVLPFQEQALSVDGRRDSFSAAGLRRDVSGPSRAALVSQLKRLNCYPIID